MIDIFYIMNNFKKDLFEVFDSIDISIYLSLFSEDISLNS